MASGRAHAAADYRFEPGAADDGVTVHVPLAALARLRPDGFEWHVPGLRQELVTALIRSLPKELRRQLVPAPEVAAQALARMTPRGAPLLDALERALAELRGVQHPALGVGSRTAARRTCGCASASRTSTASSSRPARTWTRCARPSGRGCGTSCAPPHPSWSATG